MESCVTSIVQHTINTGDSTPIRQQACQISFTLYSTVLSVLPTQPHYHCLEIYKAQWNCVVQLQRSAKSAYFHRLLLKKSHPSALWNTLKLATRTSVHTNDSFSTGSDPTSVADNLDIHFASVSCNTIAPASLSSVSSPVTPTSTSMPVLALTPTTPEWCEQAHSKLKPRCATGLDQLPPSALIAGCSIICFPLSSIINSSISSSNFPCQWKCASIRPLHKGGDHEKATNYRPISILSATSKLMEKRVQLQLSSRLNSNSLLFPLQSGFCPSHSTQTLLLHCLDRWYKAIDQKKLVGVVFLDISKAFDTVSHELLLSKLSNLGLSVSAVSWLCSYLSNCCHVTRVADLLFPWLPFLGVPQGSVLGPTLFYVFINDYPSMLPPDSTVLFADDTTIYIVSDKLTSIQSSLQLCLDLANLWLQRNGLMINVSKTKSMLIHSGRKIVDGNLTLKIEQSIVEQVWCYKFLGVVVNDTLTWVDHIDMVCKKVSRSLNLLRRLSWFLPQSLLVLFLKSYILPHFDYCDVVWFGSTKSESHRLESLLNFACCTVLRRCKHSSASAARHDLGLSTLSFRRKLHLSQTVFKCLSSHCPAYLSQLFSGPKSSHHTRSYSSCQLNLLLTKSSFGQRSFSFTGASM